MKKYLLTDQVLSDERKLLIGAYFTQEYSLESAALYNPSMVWHPDFLRKINGLYAMISRQDNENIFLMYSENLHFWYTRKLILKPTSLGIYSAW